MVVLVVDFASELYIIVRNTLVECLVIFTESMLGVKWAEYRTQIMLDMVTNHNYVGFKVEMFNQPEHVQNVIFFICDDERKPTEVKILEPNLSEIDQTVMNEIKHKASNLGLGNTFKLGLYVK